MDFLGVAVRVGVPDGTWMQHTAAKNPGNMYREWCYQRTVVVFWSAHVTVASCHFQHWHAQLHEMRTAAVSNYLRVAPFGESYQVFAHSALGISHHIYSTQCLPPEFVSVILHIYLFALVRAILEMGGVRGGGLTRSDSHALGLHATHDT